MCGRFTLQTPPETLAAEYQLPDTPSLPPRYNVAPSQLVAAVGLKADGKTRGLAYLRWGFVPSWAKDPNAGPRPINAKAETVASRPPFQHSFRDRRCLVPADGFYEWAAGDSGKVPYHFRAASGGSFAFAAVWDVWKGEGRPPISSCAVITVPANALVRTCHDRMPAILLPDQYDRWLDRRTPTPELLSMLVPFPADRMETVRVGTVVNKVANDGPECLTAAGVGP